MSTQTSIQPTASQLVPTVRKISGDRPWFWLAASWSDFVQAPWVSLFSGLVITAAMLLVVALLQPDSYPFLAAGVFAVTVFLGPVLAVGLYELSRRIEHKKPIGLLQLAFGWLRNAVGVLTAGCMLLLLMLSWYLLSMFIGTVLFGMNAAPDVVTNMENVGMLFVFSLVGAAIMTVSFILMVVAVPMMIDRPQIDVIVAMQSSIRTVKRNFGVMVLWAMLIVLFTALAVAPMFLGLSVVFPLLAYASWHAYRDLIAY